ncbi:MAG: SH3 domain-containing protein [Pseudomonadota bacterium]
MRIIFTLIATLFVFLPIAAKAQESASPAVEQAKNAYIKTSGLPIPRFISLAKNKVFMRTGPGLRYPIRWVYTKKQMPIEVIQEFDTWRKVRDVDGAEGWIHQSLLSGKRTALAQGEEGAIMLKKPESAARPVAMIESGVILTLESCAQKWCKATVDGFKGWIEKKSLWGVYADEELD